MPTWTGSSSLGSFLSPWHRSSCVTSMLCHSISNADDTLQLLFFPDSSQFQFWAIFTGNRTVTMLYSANTEQSPELSVSYSYSVFVKFVYVFTWHLSVLAVFHQRMGGGGHQLYRPGKHWSIYRGRWKEGALLGFPECCNCGQCESHNQDIRWCSEGYHLKCIIILSWKWCIFPDDVKVGDQQKRFWWFYFLFAAR